MKKRTGKFSQVEYTDGPLGELVVVKDNLPPPDQLIFTEEKTRVTINLHQASVDFFKREAKRHRTQYQKIIRSVLDGYVRNATAKTTKTAKTGKAALKKGIMKPPKSGAKERWKGSVS